MKADWLGIAHDEERGHDTNSLLAAAAGSLMLWGLLLWMIMEIF